MKRVVMVHTVDGPKPLVIDNVQDLEVVPGEPDEPAVAEKAAVEDDPGEPADPEKGVKGRPAVKGHPKVEAKPAKKGKPERTRVKLKSGGDLEVLTTLRHVVDLLNG
jgi:outer membrane biosynthesis protein TonB